MLLVQTGVSAISLCFSYDSGMKLFQKYSSIYFNYLLYSYVLLEP